MQTRGNHREASHLSAGRVDPDGAVQLLLGNAAFHGHAEALRHLAGVRTQVVEADDSVLHRGEKADGHTMFYG